MYLYFSNLILKYMYKLFLSFILFSIISTAASAGNYEKAWDAFKNNQRTEAKFLFKKATEEDGINKSNAWLGLMLTQWLCSKNDSAFLSFEEFYKTAENPYPFLYAYWSMPILYGSRYNLKPEKVKFLNQIIDDPKAHGTLKAMAHIALGHHFESINKFKERKNEYDKIGSIDNWQVLGTFDNTSGSGFTKDWGALKNKTTESFKNKVGADVKWFAPPFQRDDRWFYFDYYFNIGNSIMYAQTYVYSATEQEVTLRSGCSGSMKIWVNDYNILSEATERNADLDIYNQKIKLNKGYNRFLVQIGESETNAANFLIRLTDDKGNPVAGIFSTNKTNDYTAAADYKVSAEALFAEDFFEKKLKTNPDDLLTLLMYADALMRNDKVYESRKVLKHTQDLAPKSTFVSDRMIEAYARDKNQTDLTKEQEKIKRNDPESLEALQMLVGEANNREDYDETAKLIDKIKAIYKDEELVEGYQLNLFANKKQIPELLEFGKQLYQKHPDMEEMMNLAYNIEMNKSKDENKAIKIVKEFCKKYYSESAQKMLIQHLFKNGNKSEALAMMKKRIDNSPYAIGFYSQLSDVNYELQDYQEALNWNDKTIEFAPYVGAYYADRGKIMEALNRKDDAEAAYKSAINYTPTDYDSRAALRKLQGKKDLYENFETTDAYELFKKSPSSKEYPNDNSIILLNETQRIIYNEAASEQKEELMVKVFNQSGIDTWKQYNISYNPYSQRVVLDKAELLKADGSRVKAEENDGTVVFTNLEAGDAIHILYKLESYSSGKLSQYFWDQFHFQYSIPSLKAKYSILVPDSKTFQHEILNGTLQPTIKNLEAMKLYTWEMDNQAAIKSEPYMPELVDVAPTLFISSIPDWKFMSNWYSDLSSSKAKQDFEVKEVVAELLKDKKDISDLDKAKLLYNYIANNIAYSNVPFMHSAIIPQKAARTIATKLGDCKDVSTLFVAMCKEANLKANLVLVDTRGNGENHLHLPSMDFNHCISLLTIGDKKYFIELTNQKLAFANMPSADVRANSLFIPRDGDQPATALAKVDLPTMILNKIERTSIVKLEGNDVTFSRNITRWGATASAMRSDYVDLGQEEREKTLTQNVSSGYKSQLKLNYLKFGDLKKLQDTLKMEYSFTLKKEVNEIAGMKVFRIPWADAVETLDFVALEKRTYPFDVWEYTSLKSNIEQITIELPAGVSLQERPNSVNLTCPVAEYHLNYDYSNSGKIIVSREMKIIGDIVKPEDYATFKEFYNKVAEADTKQLAYK